MRRVLFFIHDLGQGGAEKVLVNLVNNINKQEFNITVISLFGGGINEQFLNQDINYYSIFKQNIPGNSYLLKLFTPKQLHKLFIKDSYDIEISYLEGPSARIISGCPNPNVKLITWIHSVQNNIKSLSRSFRNSREALQCYEKFNTIICVSDFIKKEFQLITDNKIKCEVLYNVIESEKIIKESNISAYEINETTEIKLISVGTLKEIKGVDRLLRIIKRLINNNYKLHLYILGKGPLEDKLKNYVSEKCLTDYVTFLGYHTNPYKFVSKCDLFVCSSYSEGFSTATTEALIVGTAVCTVDVSGMKEMLGRNEYGIITENNEESLYQGIKLLLDNYELLMYYKNQAKIRGKEFSTELTVKAIEKMLSDLLEE